jgi:hypothetical protein
MRAQLAAFILGFLLLPGSAICETECIAVAIKPIHHISGFVIDPSGAVVSDATVTVLDGEREIAKQQTDKDGRFSFEGLKAGNYNILIRKPGFLAAASAITLATPKEKRKDELGVELDVGMGCSVVTQGKKLKKQKP